MLCIAMECKGPTYTKDENYDIKTWLINLLTS